MSIRNDKQKIDTKTVIDRDIGRCGLCNNYLSVPPVFCVIDKVCEQYRCGRCKDLVEYNIYCRNTCYENVAKYLSFPCIYEQCKEQIPWEQVKYHEKICPYRTVSCSWYLYCAKTVQISELQSHLKQVHSITTWYGKADFSRKLCIATRLHSIDLLVEENQLYFIYIIAISGQVLINVFSLSLLPYCSKFDVNLSTSKSSYSVVYKNQRIVAFDEKQHCLKCMMGLCHKIHHPYSLLYNKSRRNLNFITTKLKIESLLDLLSNPEDVKFTITLK